MASVNGCMDSTAGIDPKLFYLAVAGLTWLLIYAWRKFSISTWNAVTRQKPILENLPALVLSGLMSAAPAIDKGFLAVVVNLIYGAIASGSVSIVTHHMLKDSPLPYEGAGGTPPAPVSTSGPTNLIRGLVAFLALGLFGGAVGCAHLQPVVNDLPRAIAYAQDAELALDIAETAERSIFMVSPNPALQAKVETGIADARTALDAGIRICLGGENLSQAQIDQAFGNFKQAYTDIMALLGPLGVHRANPGGKSGARPGGGYVVVDPLLVASK